MIIQWIVLGIFIILGLLFLKMDHSLRKVKLVALILIGILIYFSIVGIFSSEKLDLKSPRGVVSAVYFYFGWIGETTGKLWDIGTETVTLVGNAVKVDNSSEDKSKR